VSPVQAVWARNWTQPGKRALPGLHECGPPARLTYAAWAVALSYTASVSVAMRSQE
jgi:hypothetical protein